MAKEIRVKCPHCGATLNVPYEMKDDRKFMCSKCGKQFFNPRKKYVPVGSTINNTIHQKEYSYNSNFADGADKGKIKGKRISAATIISFILALIIYFNCDGGFGGSTPQIGDRVVFVKNTFGAIDKDAMDEIAHAANANDEQGIFQLMLSGRACSISNGESGIMVHGSFSGIQVRLSGGSSWWVPTNTVKVDSSEK